MAGDYRVNRNEMIKCLSDAWDAARTAQRVTLPGPKLVIAAIDGDGMPNDNPTKEPWARLRIQHTASRSTAISGRRWRNDGTITFQVFVQQKTSGDWNTCELLAAAVVQSVRNHRGNVQFKDVALRERPINNGFSQVDVFAGFWWNEITGAK